MYKFLKKKITNSVIINKCNSRVTYQTLLFSWKIPKYLQRKFSFLPFCMVGIDLNVHYLVFINH